MAVELKWNKSVKAAIRQIKDWCYTGALSDHHGEVILAGINYTKKTGKYSCRIEKQIGMDSNKRKLFNQRRMSAAAADHHIAIDGTLKQDTCTVNNLSPSIYSEL